VRGAPGNRRPYRDRSNNIHIGSVGTTTDTALIRIGTVGTQTATFIAAINGVNIGLGATVLVNANGQLGTIMSAAGFKEGIEDLGEGSLRLLGLPPVRFRYKPQHDDPSRPCSTGSWRRRWLRSSPSWCTQARTVPVLGALPPAERPPAERVAAAGAGNCRAAQPAAGTRRAAGAGARADRWTGSRQRVSDRSLLTTALVAAQLPENVPEARMVRAWAKRAHAALRIV
jgi:hypothetical protein